MGKRKGNSVQHSAADMIYSSLQVAALTGVSLRQLQWWDEQGVVTPMQRAHRRLYRRSEVLEVALIVGLRRKGVSLQKIRQILGDLGGQIGQTCFDLHAEGADVYLLTAGDAVHLENSPAKIVRVLRDSSEPVIALCVSALIRRIVAPEELPKPVRSETSSTGRRRVARAS